MAHLLLHLLPFFLEVHQGPALAEVAAFDFALGATDYFTKPIDWPRLLAANGAPFIS